MNKEKLVFSPVNFPPGRTISALRVVTLPRQQMSVLGCLSFRQLQLNHPSAGGAGASPS